MASDSTQGNQNPSLCPHSCQMIPGTVLPTTAAQAITRGQELEAAEAGMAGFIAVADFAAKITGARASRLGFRVQGSRPRAGAAIGARRAHDREMPCVLSPVREIRRRRALA